MYRLCMGMCRQIMPILCTFCVCMFACASVHAHTPFNPSNVLLKQTTNNFYQNYHTIIIHQLHTLELHH